jgi:hypothetical protein
MRGWTEEERKPYGIYLKVHTDERYRRGCFSSDPEIAACLAVYNAGRDSLWTYDVDSLAQHLREKLSEVDIIELVTKLRVDE